jgi:phenylpropionate dioxygenase-like ring-hydroxylating dioxygenase large terminal subunit
MASLSVAGSSDAEPVAGGLIAKAPYLSREFLRLEEERLWPRTWLLACREEEVRKAGDFVVFEIGAESIIVVRDRTHTINAFFNVCQHRGRQLLDKPGCGHTAKLFCKYHGWRWNLDGSNDVVLDRDDWSGSLRDEDIALKSLKVELWGGFVFVNMAQDAEPFEAFLAPVMHAFRNYDMQDLRLSWKRTTGINCNWKVALDVFVEGYHAQVAHRQGNLGTGENKYLCEVFGPHSVFRYRGMPTVGHLQHNFDYIGSLPEDIENYRGINTVPERMRLYFHTLHNDLDTLITKRMLRAVDRAVAELPADVPYGELMQTVQRYHREEAAKDGVSWEKMSPEEIRFMGMDWAIFPNIALLPSVDAVLLYRARPRGDDPDRCWLDVWSLERFAPGAEPVVDEQTFDDWSEGTWPRIYVQDFESIPFVQKGMKSRGFDRAITNPLAETTIANFHHHLHKAVGYSE